MVVWPSIAATPDNTSFNIQNPIPHPSQKEKVLLETRRAKECQRGIAGAAERAKEGNRVPSESSDTRLGAGGREFESHHSDHLHQKDRLFRRSFCVILSFFESNALHIVRLAAFAPSGHMIRGRLAGACRFLLTDDRARLKALLIGGNTRPCWSPRGQREEESTLWLKLRGCSLCLSGSKLHFLPRLRKSSSMASFQRASRGALLRTAETAASIAS